MYIPRVHQGGQCPFAVMHFAGIGGSGVWGQCAGRAGYRGEGGCSLMRWFSHFSRQQLPEELAGRPGGGSRLGWYPCPASEQPCARGSQGSFSRGHFTFPASFVDTHTLPGWKAGRGVRTAVASPPWMGCCLVSAAPSAPQLAELRRSGSGHCDSVPPCGHCCASS